MDDEKFLNVLFHVLKEGHVLDNYMRRMNASNKKELIDILNKKLKNTCTEQYKYISHSFTWGDNRVLRYCMSHYKLCYILDSIYGVVIDNETIYSLIHRSYSCSSNPAINCYYRYFNENYKNLFP